VPSKRAVSNLISRSVPNSSDRGASRLLHTEAPSWTPAAPCAPHLAASVAMGGSPSEAESLHEAASIGLASACCPMGRAKGFTTPRDLHRGWHTNQRAWQYLQDKPMMTTMQRFTPTINQPCPVQLIE